MVSTSTRNAIEEEEPFALSAVRRTCRYCPQLIVWMPTYLLGRRLAFDADPVPVGHDDGTGWLAGRFHTGRRGVQTVLAPAHEHAAEARARARTVLRLHVCPGRRRR